MAKYKKSTYRGYGLSADNPIFRLSKVRKVADSIFDVNESYWEYSDGNVWHIGISKAINLGEVESFIARVRDGNYRAKLVVQK